MRGARKESDDTSAARMPRAKQQRDEVVQPDGMHELQHSAGNQALLGLLSTGAVQRKGKDGEPEATPEASPTTAAAKAAPSLIVEDEAQDVKPGQMRKSEFLSQLRTSVCSTAEEALAGTMWSAMGCPYIERWLDHYSKQPSSHLERALRKYAPETASARTAQDYFPLVTQKLRRGIEEWKTTGEVPELPAELAGAEMPGMTVGGMIGGLLSGAGSAISGLVSGAGQALSSLGSMLFKHREGGGETESTEDPEVIRAQLGSGQSLDGAVQQRMKSAFGVDFAGVRVHTDTRARELSEGLHARAFTIGSDIAFGSEEYKPGTPVGDALIAHELAHVVQQGAGQSSGPMQKAPGGSDQLEEDADLSAVGAMVSTWTGVKDGLANIGRNAVPRLRSGLRLQKCEETKPKEKTEREKEIERLGGKQYAFMEEKRKKEEDRLKKEAEEEAKKKGLEPPTTAPKVDLGDIIKGETEKHGLKGGPTDEWKNADQPAWRKRADDAWKSVLASVKGTELEDIAKGVTFKFDPETALKEGWYAWQKEHTLGVGMGWVRIVEKDPKNAWENLAHEMGGHFKYGRTYASEIMAAALSTLSEADRKKFKGNEQEFFETYEYPETEIYSSIWQRRYRVPVSGPAPESGGIHPDDNINNKLTTMREVLQPDVARAVLQELKRRIDANDQILKRDKDFYVAKVKEHFGYDL